MCQGCAQASGHPVLPWLCQCNGAGGQPGAADTEASCFSSTAALHGLAHQLPAANPADGFISHPAASWCLLAATLALCRYFVVPPGGVLSHGGEQKFFPLRLPVKTRSLSPQSVSAPKLAPAGIDGNCSEQPDVGPHLSVLAVVLPWGGLPASAE